MNNKDNLSIGAKYLTNRKVTNRQTEEYINNQTNIQTEQGIKREHINVETLSVTHYFG